MVDPHPDGSESVPKHLPLKITAVEIKSLPKSPLDTQYVNLDDPRNWVTSGNIHKYPVLLWGSYTYCGKYL